MKRMLLCLVAITAWAGNPAAQAQIVSPFQATYRPLGLPVVGNVYLAATDTKSIAFQLLAPGYVSYIQKMLPEAVAFTGEGLYQLDATRLYFTFAYAPRIYYIYEGACSMNALGVTIGNAAPPTSSAPTGTNYTVFPLEQSSIAPLCASGSGVRSQAEPLMVGDFVQLPTVNAGQQLAFFIMAHMDSTGNPANIYYNRHDDQCRRLPTHGGVLSGQTVST